MADTYTASPFETASASFSSILRAIGTFMEEFGRARAASAMYEDLNGLSDEQLDGLGLERNDIARKVAAKVYDIR